MGIMRSRSEVGGQQKNGSSVVRKDSVTADRSTTAVDSQPQKSVSSQERPKTTHSQPDRPKTADKHGQDRPKTADRHQAVDSRRSFSRPRTATTTSANSAGKSKPRNADRDQELAVPTQTLEYKTGKDIYNFPTPSPRMPPPRSATSQPSPARSPLPGAGPTDDSPKIGVAIGSPSQGSQQWGRSHTVDQVATTKITKRPPPARAVTDMPKVSERATEQVPKKKGSWKNFGGIFGRKPSTKGVAPQPFYQLDAAQERDEPGFAAPTRTLHSTSRQVPKSPWTPADSASATERPKAQTMPRGMARMEARAEADRALFEETTTEHPKQTTRRRIRTPSIIQKEGSSPAFGSPAPRSSEDIFKTAESCKRNDSPLSVTGGSGPLRLDLDIPDHHMERYSIMFENFLSTSGERRPSIIERRQSKLQRKRSLKRLDDANRKDSLDTPKVPQRSATSPHLIRIPSLSIKTGKKVRSPNSSPVAATAGEKQTPVTAVHNPRTIKRSNTAPIQASSPVRHNFSKPRMVMVAEPVVDDLAVAPSQQAARGLSIYSENSLPPTPPGGRSSGEESPIRMPPLPTMPSTSSIDTKADNAATWHVLNANPNSTAVPKRKMSLTRQEPSRTHSDPYRRVKSPEDLESKIVQVSVARQVSVSKARNTVRQAHDVKQPLRPRVVELGKNRKSTMVLIEGGEE